MTTPLDLGPITPFIINGEERVSTVVKAQGYEDPYRQ